MQKITARPRRPAKPSQQGARPSVLAASSTDAGYGQRKPAKVKAPKAKRQRPERRGPGKALHHYWLTPKAWARPCSHCEATHAAAVRPRDHKAACADCVDRLGIKALESQAWRDGGARAGSTVTSRHVDPATLRPKVKR